MMFFTHIISSLYIGLFLMDKFSNKYLFLGLLLIGSLLPDLDNPYSKLGGKIRPISTIIRFIFGHRGIFHSVFPALLIFVVFYLFLDMKLYGISLSLGFILHLVMDGLTKEGINFLYPLSKFKISGFIKTGGIFEWILFCSLVILTFLKVKTIL